LTELKTNFQTNPILKKIKR